MMMELVFPSVRTKKMLDNLLIHALLAGVGICFLAGPLGCFVVWRRMSYFGATLAHAALLGVGLGFVLSINVYIAIIGICVAVSLILVALVKDLRFADDTILGILAHGTLAAGIISVSMFSNVRLDIMTYLFGDILSVSTADLVWIYCGGAISLICLFCLWRPLISITADADIAFVEGVSVSVVRIIFMILIAFVIAVTMKIVGVLLIISLLIIPAAAARPFSRTPEQMALVAIAIGSISVVMGLKLSWWVDTPASPSIVVAATALFFLTLIKKQR